MLICSYCGKYCAIPRRSTAEFCNLTADENGYTCREYKSALTGLRQGKSAPVLSVLGVLRLKGRLDECTAGTISFEEFKKWLAEP